MLYWIYVGLHDLRSKALLFSLGACVWVTVVLFLCDSATLALGSFQEQKEQISWLLILSSSRPQCMVWWELVFSATEKSIIEH